MTRDNQGAATAAPAFEVRLIDEQGQQVGVLKRDEAPLHFREWVEQYIAEQEADE